jgi:hypothetical protein
LTEASARQAAVQLFLRTGEYDLKFPAWPGNVIERETKATDDMLQALVAEVEKRSGRSDPVSFPADLVTFYVFHGNSFSCAWRLTDWSSRLFQAPGNVKLRLPPRQSRGISLHGLVQLGLIDFA